MGWRINAMKHAQRREQQGGEVCESKFHEDSSIQMDLVTT
jgi:predicted PolB exonuclease-like 3'-5' exonuclease